MSEIEKDTLVERLRINAASWRRDDCLEARDEGEAEINDEAASRITSDATRIAELEAEVAKLPFVVQYRRIDVGTAWHDMAAFDAEGAAERYCADCAASNKIWEYRHGSRKALEDAS